MPRAIGVMALGVCPTKVWDAEHGDGLLGWMGEVVAAPPRLSTGVWFLSFSLAVGQGQVLRHHQPSSYRSKELEQVVSSADESPLTSHFLFTS